MTPLSLPMLLTWNMPLVAERPLSVEHGTAQAPGSKLPQSQLVRARELTR